MLPWWNASGWRARYSSTHWAKATSKGPLNQVPVHLRRFIQMTGSESIRFLHERETWAAANNVGGGRNWSMYDASSRGSIPTKS